MSRALTEKKTLLSAPEPHFFLFVFVVYLRAKPLRKKRKNRLSPHFLGLQSNGMLIILPYSSIKALNTRHQKDTVHRSAILSLRREKREGRRRKRLAASKEAFETPELLSLIFIFCLPRDGFATHKLDKAPAKLTLICKYWRDVALSTPELWSSLRLKARECNQNVAKRHRWILSKWLAHSKSCPFSFHLVYSGRRIADRETHEECVVSILLQHSRRWHTVIVKIPYCPTLLTGLTNSEYLASVNIEFASDGLVPPLEARQGYVHFMNLSNKQCLKRFRFSGLSDVICWDVIPPRLEKLALFNCTLCIEASSDVTSTLRTAWLLDVTASKQTLFALSVCAPELQDLELTNFHERQRDTRLDRRISDQDGRLEKLHFPVLRKLMLCEYGAGADHVLQSALLNTISTPSLVSLNVLFSLGSGGEPSLMEELKRFLQRECGSVKNLQLLTDRADARFMIDNFPNVPRVEQLTFVSTQNNLVLSALSDPFAYNRKGKSGEKSPSGAYCPRLRSLDVRSWFHTPPTSEKEVLSLIRNRNWLQALIRDSSRPTRSITSLSVTILYSAPVLKGLIRDVRSYGLGLASCMLFEGKTLANISLSKR